MLAPGAICIRRGRASGRRLERAAPCRAWLGGNGWAADTGQAVIGRVRGQLLEVVGRTALIEAAGVAYELEVSAQALQALPEAGGEAALHTHFLVRDDAQQLYGFASRAERDLFRALLRIGGVGPKLALAVISAMPLGELVLAAVAGDASRLVQVPGVGRKTAQRMLVDLKDRLAELDIEADGAAPAAVGEQAAEAERALAALGYKPAEVRRALAEVPDEAASPEQILREALKRLVRP